jgi:hypothetical protein
MKRVLVNNQKMNGLSFYRVQGVFAYLEQEMPEIKFGYDSPDFSWREMLHWDIVYFNRASGKESLEALNNIKALKKRIWLDFDDNTFYLDKKHQHHDHYAKSETTEIFKKILAVADVVTVTTNYLKSIFEEYNSNIIVIPNSYDERMFPFRDMGNIERPKVVLWRGSNFHRHDLFQFKEQLIKITSENKNFTWAFMGDDPWFIKNDENENVIKYIPPSDAIKYYYELYNNSPLLVHVPLKNDEFNLAKSNIAMLEAVLAGTTVLAPKTEEWEHNGVFTYTSEKDYYEKLQALIYSSDTYITKHYNLLVEEVKDKFLLSKTNELRKEIIRNL